MTFVFDMVVVRASNSSIDKSYEGSSEEGQKTWFRGGNYSHSPQLSIQGFEGGAKCLTEFQNDGVKMLNSNA